MPIRLPLLIATVLMLSCFHPRTSGAQVPGSSPPGNSNPRPADLDEISRRAQDALKAGKFEDAARLYRQVVKQRPHSAADWGYLAASLYNLNRYREARDAYQQTAILTPRNPLSWAFLGLCEYELREYPHAFDHLFKAENLGLGGDRDLIAQVKYHLAILWNTAGQFEMGLKEIAWFAQQNLGSPEIIEVFGLSLLRIPDFPEELPKDKSDMVMLAGQAGYAANSQKLDLAQKYYDELEAKYPNQPNVHYAYGLFISSRDLDAALKQYQEETEINPSQALAQIQAAFLYLKMGKPENALKDAQSAVQLDPHNPAAHNLAGRALLDLNRTTEAIPELALASRLAPQNSSFHLNLARAYQKAGNKALAAKEMDTFNLLESKKAPVTGPQ